MDHARYYDALHPLFTWLPTDIIKKTFKAGHHPVCMDASQYCPLKML
jgi:hypothetical protein